MVFLEIFLIVSFQEYDIQRLPVQWLTDASFGKLTIFEVGCSISKGLGIWYLEDFYSSLLGHLQTFLYSPIALDFKKFLSVDIITLFTLVLLRHWGGVIVVWFFSLLCFTLCPFVTKRGSNFWFGLRMYFQTGQVIFVPEWPKGEFVSILVSFCVWTKSLKCKDAVNRDSTF
jgi:hypothetical protein